MSFGEIIFYSAIVLIAFATLTRLFKRSQAETDDERRLKESLSDPYIYDPETGAKITLEQAQSGDWPDAQDQNRIKSQLEIDHYEGCRKAVEQTGNYLKSRGYKSVRLDEQQINALDQSLMMSKYSDWSYTGAYDLTGGNFVIFPDVRIVSKERRQSGFQGHQILFIVKITNIFAHYYLKEKETIEKIFDLVRNDDDFDLDGFEVFTVKAGKTAHSVRRQLQRWSGQKNLEIEIWDENLFIKTTNAPSVEQFNRLFSIIAGDISTG